MTPPAVLFGDRLDLRRSHWFSLTPAEQANSIRRLAASGMSDHTIAAATGLSTEMIRRILSEREVQR